MRWEAPMKFQIISPNNKICAMCKYWNGHLGGRYVRPQKNMKNSFEFYSEEENVCYENHLQKKAWHSCSKWSKRY